MIPRINHHIEEGDWKKLLQNGIRDLPSLANYLQIPLHKLIPKGCDQSSLEAGFPMRIPLPYASRIQKGNLLDPLLMQVLPSLLEQSEAPLFTADPLDESSFNPVSGLLHKYASRALLVVSGACPIHCRYCFRRSFQYNENNPGKQQWQQAFQYINDDKSLNEIIFSGGDPLNLPDSYLSWLSEQIIKIPHIRRLRIHSRFPVVIPQRISAEFIKWLNSIPLQKVMVLHINHANEIDDEVIAAVKKLSNAGVTLLNQSVLLHGVNDDARPLIELSERLFSIGILPYYLHLPDKVSGTAHFDVAEAIAIDIHTQMQAHLPGYLVPKLVREIPGENSKTLITRAPINEIKIESILE